MPTPRSYSYTYTAPKSAFIVIFEDGTPPSTIWAYTFDEAKTIAIETYKYKNWTLTESS